MEVSGHLFTPGVLLYPRYPLDTRVGGTQSRFGSSGEEKENIFIASVGNQMPVVQSVTVLTAMPEPSEQLNVTIIRD